MVPNGTLERRVNNGFDPPTMGHIFLHHSSKSIFLRVKIAHNIFQFCSFYIAMKKNYLIFNILKHENIQPASELFEFIFLHVHKKDLKIRKNNMCTDRFIE